jgi:hypothetical protein
MPAFAAYNALIDALIVTIKAVWPEVQKIHVGWPAKAPTEWPYAVIALPEEEPLKIAPGGIVAYWQIPEITITGRFLLPSANEGHQRTQITKANLLIAALEASSVYPAPGTAVVQDTLANVGPLPSPMSIEGRGANHFLEVNVLFTCRARELHHSHQ